MWNGEKKTTFTNPSYTPRSNHTSPQLEKRSLSNGIKHAHLFPFLTLWLCEVRFTCVLVLGGDKVKLFECCIFGGIQSAIIPMRIRGADLNFRYNVSADSRATLKWRLRESNQTRGVWSSSCYPTISWKWRTWFALHFFPLAFFSTAGTTHTQHHDRTSSTHAHTFARAHKLFSSEQYVCRQTSLLLRRQWRHWLKRSPYVSNQLLCYV